MKKTLLRLTLNGQERVDAVAGNTLLIDYVREVVGLTGTKMGCDGGECGACTVLVDGEPRLSCITMAVSVEGCHVETIESLAEGSRLSALQKSFHQMLGSQCGFCTPGMIMASEGLLRKIPHPSVEEIRTGLSANICRCTGYVKIIESVQVAAETREEAAA